MKSSPCTPPHWELSKDIKNTIWSILVRWISLLQNKTKQTTFLHGSMWNELHWIEGHGHLERVALVPPIPINVANCIKYPRSIWSHRSPTPSSPIKVVLRILWCNHPKNNVAKLSYILYMKICKKNFFLNYRYLLELIMKIWRYHFFYFFNLENFGQFYDEKCFS